MLQTQKLQKGARKIRSGLQPAVKISSDGDFAATTKLSLPKLEVLMRRQDKCDLVSYTLPVDNWFRVFFRNASNRTVLLCPVHIDAKNVKLEVPSLTVQPGQERDIALSLVVYAGERDQRMEIYGENKIMLLELRFSPSTDRESFSLAREDPETERSESESDSEYFDAPEPTPTTPPAPTSALAVVPVVKPSYHRTIAAKNAFDPTKHAGDTMKTDARLGRMQALLR
jgi:hypothetical protein